MIETLKPTTNNVLVKLKEKFNNEVTFGDGTKIEIPVDVNNTSEFLSTEGIVIAVPKKLNKSPWETTMQIIPGDTVFFSFNALREAIYSKGSLIHEGGELYAIINYHTLIAARRGGVIVPLNGYCFVKPLREDELPGSIVKKHEDIILNKKRSNRFGEVVLMAEPNLSYENGKDVDLHTPIPTGSIVFFHKKTDVVVQYAVQASLFGKQEMFRIQSRYFNAIILPDGK